MDSMMDSLVRLGTVREMVPSSSEMTRTSSSLLPTEWSSPSPDASLAEELAARDVVFSSRPENSFLRTLFASLLPILLLVGFWLVLLRRMGGAAGPGGGILSIGKSKAKTYAETDTRVQFADVAGVDEAVEELREVVDFLDVDAGSPRMAEWFIGRFGTAHWPTFNVADSAIVTGAGLLLLGIVRPLTATPATESTEPAAGPDPRR